MTSPHTPSRRELREFGLLIGIFFPVVFGWLGPILRGHAMPIWPLIVGIPAILLGLAFPKALAWPYRGWMALGHALGWINSHLILGLVFVLLIQPMALFKRMSGFDPLRRRFETKKTSYRESNKTYNVDLTRIF